MPTMFLFPVMFTPHIEGSSLKCPPDWEIYKVEDYPHFAVFMNLHLGAPIEIDYLKQNADIIASISDEEILTVTPQDLFNKGVVLGQTGFFA